jgi:hypothetical protein
MMAQVATLSNNVKENVLGVSMLATSPAYLTFLILVTLTTTKYNIKTDLRKTQTHSLELNKFTWDKAQW